MLDFLRYLSDYMTQSPYIPKFHPWTEIRGKGFLCRECKKLLDFSATSFEWKPGKRLGYFCDYQHLKDCLSGARNVMINTIREIYYSRLDLNHKYYTHQELFEAGVLELFDYEPNCSCEHPLGNYLCTDESTCIKNHVFNCLEGIENEEKIKNFKNEMLRIIDKVISNRATTTTSAYTPSSSPTTSHSETEETNNRQSTYQISNTTSQASEEQPTNNTSAPNASEGSNKSSSKTEFQENSKAQEPTVSSTTTSPRPPSANPKQVFKNSETPNTSPNLKEVPENQAKLLPSLTEQKKLFGKKLRKS